MANQISVNGSGVVQVNVEPTSTIQVNTGRTVIANISNVPSANTANFAFFANVANTANYAGNVTGNAQPNITSVGTLTTLAVTGNVSANYFVGNGYTLTAINGANVVGNISGNISNAVYAEFAGVAATANAVAGANVTGTVANATYALFAGTANTANSVQGSNVIGSVAQANFANTANAVAGANVSGTVANAQFANFAGTANTANAVDGANVIGTVANANYAAFSGNVVNSAQPNITSLGTLNALSVTGNVSANYFVGNGFTLSAINGANIVGNISGNISNAVYAEFAGTANTANVANSVSGANVVGSVAQANFANTANAVAGANVSGAVANAIYSDFSGVAASANAVAGANVSGVVANANYAAFSGNVVNSAQPNITSVGSLTGLQVSGNALVTGNLIVDGNLVYVNVENFNVEDPIVELGGGANGAPLTTNDGKDRGAILNYYTTAPVKAFMGYDNSNAELLFATNVSVTNEVVTVNTFGNVRVGNVIGNLFGVANSAVTANTVTENAQPNITSVGTLANLTVTGNVSANYFIGNGYTLTAVNGANIIGNITGNISNADYALFAGTANTANSVAGANVTGVVANANYAAYAGNAFSVAGSNVVGPVAFATTANSVSGANVSGAVANAVYADFSGVAASANAVAGANVSGIVANANYAAFSGNVTNNAQPNITSVGTLSSLDVTGNVSANYYFGNGALLSGIVAAGGNANYANFAGNAFSVDGANVVGPVAFATTANSVAGANVSGTVANAEYANFAGVAGTANAVAGANVTGIVANANYAAFSGNVTVNAQPNITSVGTLANLTVTGNVSANFYTGNGSLLTGITATNANYAAFSGNVTNNAQPNITSVGTLTGLTVDGNVTANVYKLNLTAAQTANAGEMTWNASDGTMDLGMLNGVTQQVGQETYFYVKANAAITNGRVVMFDGVVGGTIKAKHANTASAGFKPSYVMGVATQDIALNADGYITAFGKVNDLDTSAYPAGSLLWLEPNSDGNFIVTEPAAPGPKILVAASLSQSTFPATNGRIFVRPDFGLFMNDLHNVTANNAVTGDVLVYNSSNIWATSNTVPKANTAVTVTANAQPNITSVGTLANLTVTGNVSGNIISAASELISFGNITGNVINAGSNVISYGDMSANVIYATSNIISYGNTFAGNTIVGSDLLVYGKTNLGQVANVKILGGSNAQVLSTDGTGNLNWVTATGGSGTPGGSNTNIQFNDAGAFGGSNAFTFDKTSNVITASGNIAANFFTGNGSLLTGIATGTPNAIVNGTSNVSIPAANGNILFSANAANSMTITSSNVIIGNGTGAILSGIGSLTANVILTASGNAASPSHSFANDTNTGLYNSAADEVSIATGGTQRVLISNTVANFGGNLNSNGNFNFTGAIANLGTISNLRITGGSNTQVMTTFGNGVVFWGNGGAGNGQAIVNGNSNVVVAANSNVTVSIAGTANLVTFGSSNIIFGTTGTNGNLAGANWITANVFSGNLATANQPNITGLGTINNLVTAGNLTLAANLFQSGNAPGAATDTTIAYKIPITIDGNVYYFALTAAQ